MRPYIFRWLKIVYFPEMYQVELVGSTGKLEVVHISDVQSILPEDRVVAKLPDY